MRKILARLFTRLANWLDSTSFAGEYNQYRYQLIAQDCRKLRTIGYWIEDPYSSSKYREALLKKPEVNYSENTFPQADSDFSEDDVVSDLDERDLDKFTPKSDYEVIKNDPIFEGQFTPPPPLKEYYKPLEPFESRELQNLNLNFEYLRLTLNKYQAQSEKLEELSQSFSRETIHFLDDIEAMVRGDLTIRLKRHSRFGELGAIADAFNLIIKNFRNDIRSLPEDHPLKQKYKT